MFGDSKLNLGVLECVLLYAFCLRCCKYVLFKIKLLNKRNLN